MIKGIDIGKLHMEYFDGKNKLQPAYELDDGAT